MQSGVAQVPAHTHKGTHQCISRRRGTPSITASLPSPSSSSVRCSVETAAFCVHLGMQLNSRIPAQLCSPRWTFGSLAAQQHAGTTEASSTAALNPDPEAETRFGFTVDLSLSLQSPLRLTIILLEGPPSRREEIGLDPCFFHGWVEVCTETAPGKC